MNQGPCSTTTKQVKLTALAMWLSFGSRMSERGYRILPFFMTKESLWKQNCILDILHRGTFIGILHREIFVSAVKIKPGLPWSSQDVGNLEASSRLPAEESFDPSEELAQEKEGCYKKKKNWKELEICRIFWNKTQRCIVWCLPWLWFCIGSPHYAL